MYGLGTLPCTMTEKQNKKTQTKHTNQKKGHSENFRQISFCEDIKERKRLTEKKKEEGYYSEKDWFWKVSEQHTQKPSTDERYPCIFPHS